MSKRAGCDCKKCRELCTNEPGWFIPEEISVAADFLGLSEQAFIEKYLEEHALPSSASVALAPKMVSGRCIFQKNGLCEIHPVKPYECRKVYGCESKRRHKRIREIVARKWS